MVAVAQKQDLPGSIVRRKSPVFFEQSHPSYTVLDFEYSNLTEEIPKELGFMRELSYLHL